MKRIIFAVICIVLAGIRLIKPDAIIDGNTVWLLVIAVVVIIGPDLKVLIPLIKRIKIGDTEIELVAQAAKISKEIEKVKDEVGAQENWEIPDRTTDQVKQVLQDAKDDPRAAFLLLASKIEEEVRSRLRETDIPKSRQFTSLPRLVEFGVDRQVFPQQILPVFKEFWYVRNKVAHGQAFDFERDTILSLISVGTDILKLISIEKK